MTRLKGSGDSRRRTKRLGLVPIVALLCLPFGTLSALADSQPSSTYTSDRTAYDHAVAVGTTAALHNFLLAYPNSDLANKALELLIQHCTILRPQPDGQQFSDSSCDLQYLISPAAGPSNNDPFEDPPPEHSFRDKASNT